MIVVIGQGPIGRHVTDRYLARGEQVRVVTRSGSGPDAPSVKHVRADAQDPESIRAALSGATVVHDCMHASAYERRTWERELPAAERHVLAAAEDAGAVVVFPESLYAFTPDHPGEPITERTPTDRPRGMGEVRRDLLRARAASSAPTLSVAASDYFGPGAGDAAHAGNRMLRPATTGGTFRPLGDPDLPHSWTYLPDLAAAMVAAADLPVEPDRLLLAPTAAPRSQRELARAYAREAGRDPGSVRVRPIPSWALRAAGRLHAPTGSLASMLHLMEEPLVMDSSASESLLGVAPTPWEEAVKATVAAR